MWKFLILHSEKHTGNDKTCQYTGTALNKRWSFSVRDSVACEQRVQRKVVSEVLRKYDIYVCVCVCVCVCVQLRHDSINPETGISYANLGPETEE